MTVRCANGHASEAEDYCDVCGEPIRATSPPPAPVAPEPTPVASSCPTCGFAAAAGALFCENCGYDFTTGTSPEPISSLDLDPVAPPSDPAPVSGSASMPPPDAQAEPSAPPMAPAAEAARDPEASASHETHTAAPTILGLPLAAPTAGSSPAESVTAPAMAGPQALVPDPGPQWVVEVWIDPDWFAVQETGGSAPAAGPPTLVVVSQRSLLVGRHSISRGIFPQIDCGHDSGVSRRHCELTTDGQRWWVEDLQSSNGTYVGAADAPLPSDPIPPRTRYELEEGDRVYVGAFSRLVVREALPGEV